MEQLKQKTFRTKEVRKQEKIENIRHYGKTRKFVANKRIQMAFSHKWTDRFGFVKNTFYDDGYQYFVENPVKNLHYKKGFLFIPKNCMIVRYSKKNYKPEEVNKYLLSNIFRNLKYVTNLQHLQIVEMASLMATVKMMTATQHTFLSEVWVKFIHNFLQYCRDLTNYNSKEVLDLEKCYNTLVDKAEEFRVVVPYVIDDYYTREEAYDRIISNEKFGIILDENLTTKFPPCYKETLNFIESFKKDGESAFLDSKNEEELLSVYNRYFDGLESEKFSVSTARVRVFGEAKLYHKCPADWKADLVRKIVKNIEEGKSPLDFTSLSNQVPIDTLKKVLRVVSKLRYHEFLLDTEKPGDLQPSEVTTFVVPDKTDGILNFVRTFKAEYAYCKHLQLQVNRLYAALNFGEAPNMFFDVYTILLLATERRELDYSTSRLATFDDRKVFNSIQKYHLHEDCKRVEDTTLDFEVPSTSRDDQDLTSKSLFRKAVDTICSPLQSMKDALSSVKGTYDETNLKIQRCMDTLTTKLEDNGFNTLAKGFNDFDSSSVSTLLGSVKRLADSFFSQAMTWIYSQFGFSIDVDLDISDLVITYILWVNTTSSSVKMLILGYLAMKCGILDFVFSMIKSILCKIRDYFTAENCTFEEELEQERLSLEQLKKGVDQDIDRNKETFKKIIEPEEELDKSLFETLIEGLEKGFPVILGLGVLALSGKFAFQAVDSPNSLGDKVVKYARALSFIGLGFGGIVNIMKHVISIVKVSFDYVRTYIFKSKKTKIAKIQKVVNFLKRVSYMNGVSNYTFATDTSAAVQFFIDYLEIPEIDKFIFEIDDINLRTEYNNRRRDMTNMYGAVKAILQVAIQGKEIFHIQFYSKPGAGKTDLSQHTIKDLSREFRRVSDELDKKRGLPVLPRFDDDTVYFGMESEKYKDLYYGQKNMIIDEMGFFAAEDSESVQFKLGLFSGKPTVANKAAIEDKGMLFNLNLVVSNTNNPYPQPEGVVSPEALQRRRILIKAEVLDEFLTNGEIDNQKIIDAGCNRNMSQHLCFTILHPTKVPEQPINPHYVRLSYDQLVSLLKIKVEKHIMTEESRLSNRAGVYAHLKSYIENLISRVEASTINVADTQKIRKEIARVAKFVKQCKTEELTDPVFLTKTFRPLNKMVCSSITQYNRVRDLFNEFHTREMTGFSTVNAHVCEDCPSYCEEKEVKVDKMSLLVNFCPKCFYQMSKEFRELMQTEKLLHTYAHIHYEVEPDFTTEEEVEDTSLDPQTNMNTTILVERKDNRGNPYLVLQPGVEFQNIPPSTKNPKMCNFGIYKIGEAYEITYQGSIPSSKEEYFAILKYMRYFNSFPSVDKQRVEIDKHKKKHDAAVIKVAYMTRLRAHAESVWEIIKNSVSNFIGYVFSVISDGIHAGIVMFIALIVVWGSLFGLGKLLSGCVGQNEDTVAYNKTIRDNKISRRVENTAFNVSDENSDFVKKGQIIVMRMDDQGVYMKTWANGCCVKGNTFMLPYHFVERMNSKEKLLVIDPTKIKDSNGDGFHFMEVKKSDFHRIRNKDAALVAFPKLRMMKSLRSKFITEEDLGKQNINFTRFQAMYQGYKVPKNLFNISIADFEKRVNKEMFCSEYMDSIPDHDSDFKFNMYSSTALGPTDLGDSGSLVIHNNNNLQSHFIAGMMVQRTTIDRQPMGIFITQEDIDMTLKSLSLSAQIEVCHYEGMPLSVEHELHSVFDFPENVCHADKDRSISETSGFARTPIYGVFSVESEPAIQNSKDPRIVQPARHPLKVSLNKSNGLHQPFINSEEEEFMMNSLVRHYELQFKYQIRTLRVYDTIDAIRGTREAGSVPINIHSSAGVPYCDMPGVSGKRPFISYDEQQQTYVVQDRVLRDVELYEYLYKIGTIPQNMKIEFNKKELVGPNKIKEPKCRTVGTGNMIHQIIYNKINRSAQLMIKNAWKQGKTTSFAMGIDMERHGDQIVKGLVFTDNVLDFDVKAWESAINLQLLTMANKVKTILLDKAYSARNVKCSYDYRAISHALVVDYTDCDVHYKDVIYAKNSGLLSGHPGTFIENTDIHIMLVYLIARRILHKENKKGWANSVDIYNNIKVIIAADDIVMAISPLFRPYFNEENIKWGYATVGFEITSADKTPEIKVKTIEEVQFLKHMFLKGEDGVYHAYPLTSIIYQLFNWYRTDTKLAREQLLIQNYSDAFRFSFWRGEQFYEEVRAKFNSANLNNQIQWVFTHKEMAAMIEQDYFEQQLIENSKNPIAREEADILYNRFLE